MRGSKRVSSSTQSRRTPCASCLRSTSPPRRPTKPSCCSTEGSRGSHRRRRHRRLTQRVMKGGSKRPALHAVRRRIDLEEAWHAEPFLADYLSREVPGACQSATPTSPRPLRRSAADSSLGDGSP